MSTSSKIAIMPDIHPPKDSKIYFEIIGECHRAALIFALHKFGLKAERNYPVRVHKQVWDIETRGLK